LDIELLEYLKIPRDSFLLKYTIFGNSLLLWISYPIIIAITYFALRAVRNGIVNNLRRRAKTHARELLSLIANVFDQTSNWFLLLLSLKVANALVTPTGKLLTIFHHILVVGFVIQSAVWLAKIARAFVTHSVVAHNSDPARSAMAGLLTKVIQFVVWLLAFLVLLDNFGINITALVAGLGIGGVAVALAVQKLLGDFLSSISILLDQPFIVGDFITVGDFMGTVEQIGVKTTRVRSLSGEQLIFPNTDLLESRIRNFKRMEQRRVLFQFGIRYETPLEKVEQIPGLVKKIIYEQKHTLFDRAHFFKFGSYALEFEIVYFVNSSDYALYMDIQQAINISLARALKEMGVDFALSTQTMVMRNREDEEAEPAEALKGKLHV